MDKEQRYTIEVSEHQLKIIAECVEDIHRFLGGQMELDNNTCLLDNREEICDKLRELKPLVTPHLAFNASYGWSGGNCPNKHQRKRMAETYCIYREIIHQLTIQNKHESWNVYESPTLTCDEGGGLPIIKKV